MHQTIDLSLLEHTQVPIMDELFLTRSDLPARYTFLTPRWTALAHVSYNDIDQITWARPEINPGCIRKDTEMASSRQATQHILLRRSFSGSAGMMNG